MKVVIFGANGFLGKHFKKEIPSAIEITRESVNNFYFYLQSKSQFDLIIHCASTPDLIEQTILDANIIRWWRDEQPNAILVTFGTDACYSENSEHIENFYLNNTPYSKWKEYAEIKQAMIKLQSQIKRPSFHFVLTSLFGPGFKETDEHLVHSLIKKIVQSKVYSFDNVFDNVIVKSPNYLKECIYVVDVVKNVMQLISFKKPYAQIFNIGSPKKCNTIKEITKQICDVVDFPFSKIKFENYSGPYKKWLDSSLAMSLIEYADTEWAESLKPTVEYYYQIFQK